MGDISYHLSTFMLTTDRANDLIDRLKNTPLYLSDEWRDEAHISQILLSHFNGDFDNSFIEIGDWQGLFGLVNIVSGWKADLFFKLWDKAIWGAGLRREIEEALDELCEEFKLERVSLMTPDEHMAKLARTVGFVDEGKLINSFKWDGKPYDTICLVLDRRGKCQ